MVVFNLLSSNDILFVCRRSYVDAEGPPSRKSEYYCQLLLAKNVKKLIEYYTMIRIMCRKKNEKLQKKGDTLWKAVKKLICKNVFFYFSQYISTWRCDHGGLIVKEIEPPFLAEIPI